LRETVDANGKVSRKGRRDSQRRKETLPAHGTSG
jgi:hypothetical protein